MPLFGGAFRCLVFKVLAVQKNVDNILIFIPHNVAITVIITTFSCCLHFCCPHTYISVCHAIIYCARFQPYLMTIAVIQRFYSSAPHAADGHIVAPLIEIYQSFCLFARPGL